MAFLERWRKGVNAFTADEENRKEEPLPDLTSYGAVTTVRPDRPIPNSSNEASIIMSIYTRMMIDATSIEIKHVKLDDQDRYLNDMDSGLNNCLTLEANLDQAASEFRADIFLSMFEEGVLALVPIDTVAELKDGSTMDILTMRVGTIVKWYPDKVRVSVYNERAGKRQELLVPKTVVSIINNPFYNVMNRPNSTLKRLIRKLNLLDSVDEASASGKLDLIMQLPYTIKSEARRQQANARRDDIEMQLKGSKYGIAYVDATEKITQLNRPVENNLLTQIESLTKKLYGELGLTEEIMNGSASEEAMLKYWNGTIEPIVRAVVEGMRRTFLTKTARTQKQTILYFRDPFKLMPVSNIAEIADKFARNEILSSNEIRGLIGFRPSADAKADQLVNSNMPTGDTGVPVDPTAAPTEGEDPDLAAEGDEEDESESIMNSAFDDVDKQISELLASLGADDESV